MIFFRIPTLPLALAILLSTLFFLAVPKLAHAGARPFLRGEGVTIYYDESVRHMAESAIKSYQALKTGVENKIGRQLKTQPAIFLIDNEKGFQEMGGDPTDAAFTLVEDAQIVVDMTPVDRFAALSILLRHELCHVLLNDHLRTDLPDWFEEGICEWVGTACGAGTQARDGLAALSLYTKGVPLEQLRDFESEKVCSELAYGQSSDFIAYVSCRYGEKTVQRLLQSIVAGNSVREAFLKTISRPLPAVESAWRDDLAKRAGWIVLGRSLVQDALGKCSTLMVSVVARHRIWVYALLVLFFVLSLRGICRMRKRQF